MHVCACVLIINQKDSRMLFSENVISKKKKGLSFGFHMGYVWDMNSHKIYNIKPIVISKKPETIAVYFICKLNMVARKRISST